MITVSYDFYTGSYMGGAIPEDDWSRFSMLAAAELARYERIYTVTEPEDDAKEMAVCAMAEALYGFEQVQTGAGGPVQSASIGSVSVSYGSAAQSAFDLSAKGQAKELYRCASLYLDIYRGVG